ncbi:hypothetical protein ALQ59_04565 [Pseudomonas syringae pv. apii]|nr:hypothetical protein ALQ59_04565 [Pseudomonas syringae pv. apii]
MTSSNQTVLCKYRCDPPDRLASSSPFGQADLQRFYQKNRLATEIQGALRRTVFSMTTCYWLSSGVLRVCWKPRCWRPISSVLFCSLWIKRVLSLLLTAHTVIIRQKVAWPVCWGSMASDAIR